VTFPFPHYKRCPRQPPGFTFSRCPKPRFSVYSHAKVEFSPNHVDPNPFSVFHPVLVSSPCISIFAVFHPAWTSDYDAGPRCMTPPSDSRTPPLLRRDAGVNVSTDAVLMIMCNFRPTDPEFALVAFCYSACPRSGIPWARFFQFLSSPALLCDPFLFLFCKLRLRVTA